MTLVLVWRLVSLFSCSHHHLRSPLSWPSTYYHKLHLCRHCQKFRDYSRHVDCHHCRHYRRCCGEKLIVFTLFETCRFPCRSSTADTTSPASTVIITSTVPSLPINTSPTSFRDAFHASTTTTNTTNTTPSSHDTGHVHLGITSGAIPTTARTLRDKVQSSLKDISDATLAYITTNINNATISTTVPSPLTKTSTATDSSTDTTPTNGTTSASANTSCRTLFAPPLTNITPTISLTTTITSFTTTESLGANCSTTLYNPSFRYNISPDTDLVYPYTDPSRLPSLRHSPIPTLLQTPGGATRAHTTPQLPSEAQSVHQAEDTIEYPNGQDALPSTPTYSHPQNVPQDVTHSIYLYGDPISFPHIQSHFSTYPSPSSPQLGPNNNTSSPHVFNPLPAPVPTHGTIRPDTDTVHFRFSDPSLPYPLDNPPPQQHIPPPLLSSPQDLFSTHHRPQQPHPPHFDDDEHHHSAPPSPHAPAHAPSHTWIMVAREMIRQSSLTRLGLMINTAVTGVVSSNNNKKGNGDIQWCFSQVKGTLDDDVSEADIISCVEFSHDGDLLATGDKGGRVVIFQRDPASKNCLPRRGEYNVYSTFQSHEPEFDYLKSLEIEEKINKIRWLKRKNPAHFLLSTNDKTIKLWKVSERDKRAEGYNLRDESGTMRDPSGLTALRVPVLKPMELMVEASPRRIFANAHTYHINSISINSDQETYLSADDLRINLWHLEVTDQSFNIVDIKPTNMEELTEVITAAEFHPQDCNVFVYSSSKGTIRLCDMRAAALCDSHAKLFEEPEDPTNRSFFSEIISSISDVKFSNSGRYMISRDYLSVKVWDLHMETKPIETYPVHEYLRSKLCSLYENDCIFDKFECCWSGNDSAIMTGSYNNFFRMFDRTSKRDATLEASRETAKPRTILKPRRVCTGGKRKKDEISVDCLDFNKKILHTAWHPHENIIAVAATNNLYIFQDKF